MYKFGQISTQRLSTVDGRLQTIARLALRISSRRKDGGVDFAIPSSGGKRTAEEQNELYKKNVSKADGYNKKSYHQTGLALDVIPYVSVEGIKGNAIYSKRISNQKRTMYFHMVAVCMLEAANKLGMQISWGGNWQTFNDMPHYQLNKESV